MTTMPWAKTGSAMLFVGTIGPEHAGLTAGKATVLARAVNVAGL
jgi:hypothetical protein